MLAGYGKSEWSNTSGRLRHCHSWRFILNQFVRSNGNEGVELKMAVYRDTMYRRSISVTHSSRTRSCVTDRLSDYPGTLHVLHCYIRRLFLYLVAKAVTLCHKNKRQEWVLLGKRGGFLVHDLCLSDKEGTNEQASRIPRNHYRECPFKKLFRRPFEHHIFHRPLSTPWLLFSTYNCADWFRHQSRPSSSKTLRGRTRATLCRYR